MIDWSSVDWVLIWKIAGGTWIVTVLVAAIAWLVAAVMGISVHKMIKSPAEPKKTGKG